MAYSKDLEELSFQEIKQIIRNNLSLKKKKVIAERTKFLSKKQNSNKLVRSYLQSLKEASRFCEFEKLGTENITIEEELIWLQFIEGLNDVDQKNKILECLQHNNMTLEVCVEVVQQLEISDFSVTTHDISVVFQVEETIQCGTDVLQKTEVKKDKYCNFEHDLDKKVNCPAFGQTCYNCNKANHFQIVCEFEKKKKEKKDVYQVRKKIKWHTLSYAN